MIIHPSAPLQGQLVPWFQSWPARNQVIPWLSGFQLWARSVSQLKQVFRAVLSLSSCSFLDVPAVVGGAFLSGASKFGAALRVHQKGYLMTRSFLFFDTSDWFSNWFGDCFYL